MGVKTPDWVKHAVFYQIFPDRFRRSPRLEHAPGIQFKPWGASPSEQGFQGGDLLGIVDRLDYLEELGVNALYLNPIFSSAANHRYHTFDYMKVDPLLGGDAAFRELLDRTHERGMRVIIDGVFNHCGRGFWPFHHILETGKRSPYFDWFRVKGLPLRPYHSNEQQPHNYAAWWNLPALPQLNIGNPGMRRYLLEVARYWIAFGADGWRLDVPEEIEDPLFWQEFRQVVKETNPDAYTVGEIWHEADEWLQGDRFDGVMNYVLSRAAFGYFGAETVPRDYRPGGYTIERLDTAAFAAAIERMLKRHDWQVVTAQFNLLNSHDTARNLWALDGDISGVRLCLMLQMTLPGAPCIYYGEEIGMNGGPDPGCRGAFPWDERQRWNGELLETYRQAIALRHSQPALRTGAYRTLVAAGEIFGFSRSLCGDLHPAGRPADEPCGKEDQLIVLFNRAKSTARLAVPLAGEGREDEENSASAQPAYQAIWPPEAGGKMHCARNGILWDLTIPPRDTLILKKADSD
ncbi:MAG: glycoside hydrolase family 13 protein [Caldilineaceae bacterium]|nr:glycoside hydrolase family 13 protein [Caldilineaceae bacterium]